MHNVLYLRPILSDDSLDANSHNSGQYLQSQTCNSKHLRLGGKGVKTQRLHTLKCMYIYNKEDKRTTSE